MPAGTFPEIFLELLYLGKGPVESEKGEARCADQAAVGSAGRVNQISRGQLGHNQSELVQRVVMRCVSLLGRGLNSSTFFFDERECARRRGLQRRFLFVLCERRPLLMKAPPTAASPQRQPCFTTANRCLCVI